MNSTTENLDKLLSQFKNQITEQIGIDTKFQDQVSTTIYNELNNLSSEQKDRIKNASPIDFMQHFNMLISFAETYNILTNRSENKFDATTRRNLVQYSFYMLFVFLKDNCFEVTKRVISDNNSVTKRLCKYLISADIRAFRNAIGHGNWVTEFKNDGLTPTNNVIYYSAKEGNPTIKLPSGEMLIYRSGQTQNNETSLINLPQLNGHLQILSRDEVAKFQPNPLVQYKVSLDQIFFWQTVARVTAFTIYLFLQDYDSK